MPLISTFGTNSAGMFGTRKGGGGLSVATLLRAALGMGASGTTYSQGADTWTYVDLRTASSGTGTLTVNCGGSAGGGGQFSGGTGFIISGSIPLEALKGKVICFVNAGNPPVSQATNRESSGGGGFSGLIHLTDAGFLKGETVTHFISAAGGGGAAGTGDNSTGGAGQNATVYVTSGTPSGGISASKDAVGTVGYFPSINFAAKAGNRFGGGDALNNAQGIVLGGAFGDMYGNGGGGGFGPRRGSMPDGSGDPTGRSTGMDEGYASIPPMISPAGTMNTNYNGSIGGGGAGGGLGNGGVPWRVKSSGGGGGGFQGGNSGYEGTDGGATTAKAGISFCGNGATFISSSTGNSTCYCNIILSGV